MHLVYTGETVRMASLYSALFVCVCITLLLPSHVAKYYATTAYASRENSKRTDFITLNLLIGQAALVIYIYEETNSIG